MTHAPADEISLNDRVNEYLRQYSVEDNVFVLAAEAAEAAQTAQVADAEMNEYLLRRAQQELLEAQEKVAALEKLMAEQGKAD